jgi:hypothetical protein
MTFRIVFIWLLILSNISFAVERQTIRKLEGSITFDGICSVYDWD